jgi:hypothetical protein
MEKKKKLKVLIIVRGLVPPHFKNHLAENTKNYVLNKLTSQRGIITKDYYRLAKYFKKYYDVVEVLDWDGNLIKNPTCSKPIKNLKELFNKYKKESIDIIAVSLGGFIFQKTLSEIKDIKIQKVLYIGAVHNGKHLLKNVKKVINVYSTFDKMYFFANNLYEGVGNTFLNGKNVWNLSLDNISHNKLLSNILIKEPTINKKRLCDLYRSLLK